MDGRSIWRVVLGLVLIVLVVGVGVSVYNAGIAQGMAQAGQVAAGQLAGNPVIGPYPYYGYGPGFHPCGFGFGFLGVLYPLLFFFLIFGLVRAAFWGGRWGRGGGHWSGGVPPTFDEWHRRAHEGQQGTTTGQGGTAT